MFSKTKVQDESPGTRGGPGVRGRTLVVKSRKSTQNQLFCKKIQITRFFFFFKVLQVVPEYGGNKISASGVSLKWVKCNRCKRRRERERKKDQKLVITATHCKRHLGWHTQTAWANKLSRALNVTSRTFNSPEYYIMLEDAIY